MSDFVLSPVGLLLATLLSVTNVFTDVSRKKVVDRHELVAATFWIRVFAALVFAVAVAGYALAGSPPVIHAPATLAPGDIRDLPELVGRLRDPQGLPERLLSESLSDQTRKLLQGYAGPGSDDTELLKSLTADLNKALKEESLFYRLDLIRARPLAEATALRANNPRDDTVTYLNRLYLEDAFPGVFPLNRNCRLLGLDALEVQPLTAYMIYLTVLVLLIAAAQLLLMAALKASPMSLCIPFMSFTPVFLIGTAFVMLGQLPSEAKLLGVGLIVTGSLVMHRQFFAHGWAAPVRAILRERGSRYILLVAFILSLTSPIETQLILMSDTVTPAFGYGVGLCVFFGVLAAARRSDVLKVMRENPWWAITAGVLDAAALFLMYVTIRYLALVIMISIKRAGIVLAILAGWLVFKEKNITDKLIAASVMVGGALVIYLPLALWQALLLTALVLAGMTAALVSTHRPAVPAPVQPDDETAAPYKEITDDPTLKSGIRRLR